MGCVSRWRAGINVKFRAYEALDKAVLQCLADRVIAVSKQMADTLKDRGYRADMVTHIPNGIDLRTVVARRPRTAKYGRKLGIDANTILIGTVGRLSPVKGQVGLLRAAKLILQKEPRAKFLIVGGGPLERDLVALAARLQIDGACRFLGPRTDVHDLTSAMDIFVLPSLNEGIPMAILEAMALEKPVVATAVGGVPEVVQHRVTGVLVEPGDEAALANACLELARDRDRAQRLSAQAKRVVAEEFSHERCGENLMDAYRGVTVATLRHTECDQVAGDRGASLHTRQTPDRVAGPVGMRADGAMLRVVPPPGRNDAGPTSAAGDRRFRTRQPYRAKSAPSISAGDWRENSSSMERATSATRVERRRMNRIRRSPVALRTRCSTRRAC